MMAKQSSCKLRKYNIGVQIDLLEKALEREKKARKEAERILEKKSFELYNTIKELRNVSERHKQSLEEKEVLLREIHHRVKNNMQVITSLMALQARQVTDEQLLFQFQSTQHRIQSMAMIHEMLYSTGEFSTIDYEKYLKQLINGLVASIRGAESNVEVQIEAKSIRLNMDTAIPLGLLINELVTNSLKYAFPNGAVGNLSIVINHVEPHYTMCISDDGVGFPEDYDFEKASSLGLRLVMNLVTQLEGTLVRGNAKGTRYDITFKKVDSSA